MPEINREFLINRVKRIRERLELEKKKGTPESWTKCIWFDGQIFAIENLIMECNVDAGQLHFIVKQKEN
jgi:hypothetical protein